jgi:hypothetical protein
MSIKLDDLPEYLKEYIRTEDQDPCWYWVGDIRNGRPVHKYGSILMHVHQIVYLDVFKTLVTRPNRRFNRFSPVPTLCGEARCINPNHFIEEKV